MNEVELDTIGFNACAERTREGFKLMDEAELDSISYNTCKKRMSEVSKQLDRAELNAVGYNAMLLDELNEAGDRINNFFFNVKVLTKLKAKVLTKTEAKLDGSALEEGLLLDAAIDIEAKPPIAPKQLNKMEHNDFFFNVKVLTKLEAKVQTKIGANVLMFVETKLEAKLNID